MIFNIPTIGVALPDDSVWGRLYKFDATGDAGLIMPPRSYYFRDFFPLGWSELAIGLIYATTGSDAPAETEPLVDEIKSSHQISNLFHFGMSKSAGGTIDVANNENFIGYRGRFNGSPQIVASVPELTDNEFACIHNGSSQVSGSSNDLPLTEGITSEPFAMIGLKFVYDNVTNRIHIHLALDSSVALANEDANISTLTTFLNGISNSTITSNANFTIVDLSDYKSYYIYWPYVLNRLKLHCVGAIKFA